MTKQLDVIYEGGVLRPLKPIDWLEEHRQVTITMDVPGRKHPLDGWVGDMSDEDAETMRRVIDEEFEASGGKSE